MKKRQSALYFLEDISNGRGKAFKAVIPELNNGIVFGKSIKEIEEGIKCAFEFEKTHKSHGVTKIISA